MGSAVKIYKHFETPKVAGVYHRLVCLTGEKKGEAYFLMGKRVVMGRSENADITIRDLKSSREHAEIILIGDNYILTDLGSQNGIIINDLKVKQHTLTDGDKVIVGKTVYKYTLIEVKEDAKKVKESDEDSSDIKIEHDADFTDEEEAKNKKLASALVGLIFIALILLLSDNVEIEEKEERKTVKRKIQEIDNEFQAENRKLKKELKRKKKKLAIYFKRGLREYREGNFFRAISEFESAQQWSPKDPLANFYLRKTREKLDEQIQSFFNKATRDIDALKYQKAVISYCAVVRLLSDYKTDNRYITARKGLTNLEQKMGLDEGEIVCTTSKGTL